MSAEDWRATPQDVNQAVKAAYSTVVVPISFCCPITHDVMVNPVQTCDGHTYDHQSISEWFRRGHSTSPLTGLKLSTLELTPLPVFKRAIDEFMSAVPHAFYRELERLSLETAAGELEAELSTRKNLPPKANTKEVRAWRQLLLRAIRKGDAYVIKGLWEASALAAIESIMINPWPIMCAAVASGHAGVVEALAEVGLPLHVTDVTGSTLAHVTAQRGHSAVVEVLGRYGAPLHLQDKNGITPVQTAVAKDFPVVIRELARQGVPVAKTHVVPFGGNLSFVAASMSNSATISELVSYKIDPNAGVSIQADIVDKPLLHASFLGRADELATLLSVGAQVCLPAAHLSLCSQNAEAVLTVLSQDGLHLNAAVSGLVLQQFLDRYALLNYGIHTEAIRVRIKGHRQLIDKDTSYTPAHLAALVGNLGALRCLHNLGVSPDGSSIYGATPRH